MQEFKRYAHAPIVEAILDIRVTLREDVGLEALENLGDSMKNAYPTRQDLMQYEGEFKIRPRVGMSTSTRQSHVGYAFLSIDERQSFQARLDGFTFSRQAPYSGWEAFSAEARRLWSLYRSTVPVVAVTRLAVRYINRLDLPLPLGDFKDYLLTVPEVSPDLPQGLSGYFMQLQIPQEGIEAMLILNQAVLPPSNPNVVSVILDIDLFREMEVPNEEEVIWAYYEELRACKNHVFESCLTDRAKELIT